MQRLFRSLKRSFYFQQFGIHLLVLPFHLCILLTTNASSPYLLKDYHWIDYTEEMSACQVSSDMLLDQDCAICQAAVSSGFHFGQLSLLQEDPRFANLRSPTNFHIFDFRTHYFPRVLRVYSLKALHIFCPDQPTPLLLIRNIIHIQADLPGFKWKFFQDVIRDLPSESRSFFKTAICR